MSTPRKVVGLDHIAEPAPLGPSRNLIGTRPRLCPTGKIRYPNEERARTAMRSQRIKGRVELTTAYLCSQCDGWHLTSKRQRGGRPA